MTAYYNEFDPKAAAWLRELIKRGLIADGEVDERDLWDVCPADLRGFDQVHLCAGIGVWSYALRRAGVTDDQRCWTGSFPCQPFSAAGKGEGFADERHLWPAGFHLIGECRPQLLFGEQVASKAAEPWLDLVQADLEGLGYAFGACAFPSAGVGAPHIRDRAYWVADAQHAERRAELEIHGYAHGRNGPGRGGADGRLAHHHQGLEGRSGEPERSEERAVGPGGLAGGLVDADSAGSQPGWPTPSTDRHGRPVVADGGRDSAGPTNGLWRDADWLFCRDGKWRPVEPGTFPLAHGAAVRVGCVCADCLEDSTEGANDEDLRALRKIVGATDGRVPPEILQPTMPMGASEENTGEPRGRTLAGTAPVPEYALRNVRGDRREPSASPGRGPDEQRAREHPDSLPTVPQQSASCERCGATRELYAVTITGNRVAKLRGYGNAINAEAAVAWIESYLDSRTLDAEAA